MGTGLTFRHQHPHALGLQHTSNSQKIKKMFGQHDDVSYRKIPSHAMTDIKVGYYKGMEEQKNTDNSREEAPRVASRITKCNINFPGEGRRHNASRRSTLCAGELEKLYIFTVPFY